MASKLRKQVAKRKPSKTVLFSILFLAMAPIVLLQVPTSMQYTSSGTSTTSRLGKTKNYITSATNIVAKLKQLLPVQFLFKLIKYFFTFTIITGGFVTLPWHIALAIGLIRVKLTDKASTLKDSYFLFQVTTVGTNPQSTQEVIDSIHESVSDVPYDVWVVTEPEDIHTYANAKKKVVPKDFSTPNNSTGKARALHYSRNLREEKGLNSSSHWIVFFDDDSKLTRKYFQEILKMDPDSVGGQGIVGVANDYGGHFLSSLADNVRPAECISFCSIFNSRGNPISMHGEGLVVRGDIESEVGWDFGHVLGEDFLFGRELARRYPTRFEWINAEIEAKSPLSTKDFIKQRRRWCWGTLEALPQVKWSVAAFLLFRYSINVIGIIAFPAGILGSALPFSYPIPSYIRILLLLNAIGFMIYYQVGCYFNTKKFKLGKRLKYHLSTLVLQYVIYFYEIVAFTVGFLKGKPEHFEVIDKSKK